MLAALASWHGLADVLLTCFLLLLSCQAIVDLARQKDIDQPGMRTLGVLTKPDTIEEGTHQQVGGMLLQQGVVAAPPVAACCKSEGAWRGHQRHFI